VSALNALRWNGEPGHYEVHYLTTTDPATGTGLWIRFTMLAPLDGDPTCSLWFVATFPDAPAVARKVTFPIAQLEAQIDPFRLAIEGAELTDTGTRGAFDDVTWDLRWAPAPRGYQHVSAPLQRLGVAKTVLVLPQADVAIAGTVTLPDGRELALDGVHGGQAHLWGSKHSARWTWAHCGDFTDPEGARQPDTFLDGVSVFVPRFGREVGPSSPIVGRFGGEDFLATSPLALLRAPSRFALTSWAFEARAGKRRIVGEVDAPRGSLAGVTYTDPDGEKAYCYNSEVASMRISVFHRASGRWDLRETLLSRGRAHFEYGQRAPVPGLELHLP
jgi:hypothetical protein